jgi:hypothetical protein
MPVMTTSEVGPRGAIDSRTFIAWVWVAAVLVLTGLVVCVSVQAHVRTIAAASVQVQFTDLPAGTHRIVITGPHDFRRAVTVTGSAGSIGNENVPTGWITIDIQNVCQLSTVLGATGEVAKINGLNCTV